MHAPHEHESKEDLCDTVLALDKAVFGDREHPKDNPGLILETMRMSLEQKRTNEILTEWQKAFVDFRNDAKKAIGWLFALMASGIFAAVCAMIFRK